MGKRKERRLAALSNAGRRVKLDLFAEPSGDLGGSSVREEVGGDSDVKQTTELPNSPSSSSSGQQPPNPLLLLGQYSDDELEEESNQKAPKDAAANNSITDHNHQEKTLFEGKDMDMSETEDPGSHKDEGVDVDSNSACFDVSASFEGVNKGDTDAASSAYASQELGSSEHLPVDGTSESQAVGDGMLGWKVVMHEESNQYYYWNTETGETSWEVPAVLAQSVQYSSDQKMISSDNVESAAVGAHDSSSLGVDMGKSSDGLTLDGTVDTYMVPQSQVSHANSQYVEGVIQGNKNNISTGEHHTSLSATDTYPDGQSLAVSRNINDGVARDEHEEGVDLWTELIKQCEGLLERMKSLKGYEEHTLYSTKMWKYILEVEIRLADIKMLSSYGSSLLPFWCHSKTKLHQLEDTINNEVYQLAVSAQMEDDIQVITNDSLEGREKSQGSARHEFEVDGGELTQKSEHSPASTHVENDLQSEAVQGTIPSSGSPIRPVEGEATFGEFHDVEDVDMEVDMEDEDGVPAPDMGAEDLSSNKVFTALPNGHAGSLASGDASIAPPPPEEEWIPPPPPDNEPVPPPPPDNEHVPPPPPGEPPETSYASVSSYTETGQPISFTEQYGLAYSDPNYQYYGATVSIPNGNFYGNADGSHLAVPHGPVYYEAVPNTYTVTAPVMVAPVEPVTYYDLHGGSVPSVPLVSSAESSHLQSSHLHTESVPLSHAFSFGQSTTVNERLEAGSKGKADVSAGNNGSNLASVGPGVASSLTTTQTPSDAKESGSTSSTTNVSVAAPSTAGKVQSKVLKTKKRTVAVAPSLRSNKKVSTLVDKWKAAKEELHENEEDEPENPYEILERKRQREIEEWKAKQIASGEAKDNANFQPLGGDWRERVKRRRAQAAKEVAKTQTETPKDENQEPDLIELSKGLPSGWQAYWDGSTKKVYYGNTITSETTWVRPTK